MFDIKLEEALLVANRYYKIEYTPNHKPISINRFLNPKISIQTMRTNIINPSQTVAINTTEIA